MPATGNEAVRIDQLFKHTSEKNTNYTNSNILTVGNVIDYKNGLYDYSFPDGYVRLEYIESDGKGQYINTGVIPTKDTRVILEIQSSTAIGECHVFGSRNGLNKDSYLCLISGDGRWRSDYSTEEGYLGSGNKSGMIHIDKNKNNTTINGTSSSLQYTNFTIKYPIYLLAVNTANSTTTFCKARLLRCDIYENDVLIRRFFPVIRTTDNAIGLYDLTNDVFYENPGNGDFIAGPKYVSRKRISDIPENYTRLEFIKSDGTGQYINTGFTPDPINTSVVMDVALYTDATDTHVVGCRHSLTSNEFCLLITQQNKWRSDYGTNQITLTQTPKIGRYGIIINGYCTKVDDELASRSSSNFTLSYPLYLFAVNTANSTSTYAPIVLYSAQIYDSGELVRNYIPCKRNSDNAVGLYDTANSMFYANSGTGSFVGGPENSIRSLALTLNQFKKFFKAKPYTTLQYIQLTGTQCVDTGYKPNQSTRVHTKIDIDSYQPSSNNGTVVIFGGRTQSSTSAGSFTLWRLSGSAFRADYGSTVNQINLSTSGSFEIDFNKNSVKINSTNKTISSATFQSSHNLLIASTFTNSGSSDYEDSENRDVRRFSGKIYWFKIYDDGTLVRDYVPAQRIEDGAVGLYDKVSGLFYENNGTGTFGAGPEVGYV